MKEYNNQMGPFLKHNNSTTKMMINLLIALLPIILFSFYKNGIIPYMNGNTDFIGLFHPLIFIGVATVTTFLVETLYAKLFLKNRYDNIMSFIKTSYSYLPGMFLGLILPINTPLSIVIFGAIIASIIGKMLFGGFGNNIFNPALIGALFITAAYSLVIANNGGYFNSFELDTISGATPLSNAKVITDIGSYDTLVKPYGTLNDFFIGTIPGAVGETSALLCLIGFLYLAFTRTIKWVIPVVYVLTVFIITSLIGNLNGLGTWFPLFHILSGGLMFGAVFMATDPVTSPTTPVGQVIYALFLGILTVAFRFLTPYPEGVLTSILTMNMLVFIIDKIGAKSRLRFYHAVVPFLAAWVIIIAMGFTIGNKYKNVNEAVDPNYHIISSDKNGSTTTYVVTEGGYHGDIKAEIIIKNNKVISFNIIDVVDSFYSKVENANYVDKLLEGQDNLENVDTVSGATITSTSIKKMLINTLEDYNKNK
ncbi:MAG: RnfABCDGE type electron transport complex subunit D [Ignavibacteriales bacterium]